MSRSGQGTKPVEVVTVGRFPMPRGTRFEPHTHVAHQLAWARSGILVVDCYEKAADGHDTDTAATWILPSTRALWIPAGVRHAAAGVGPAVMQSLYLAPESQAAESLAPESLAPEHLAPESLAPEQGLPGWAEPTPVVVEPLLAELIGYLAGDDLSAAQRGRALALVWDLLRPATTGAVHAPLPRDDRARTVARAIRAAPHDRRDLAGWAATVNVSGRTLARLFHDQTGVPFGQWRTAARIQAALVLLAQDTPVSLVARRVGYDTTSAFVAAFRRHTGTTPGSYFSARGATMRSER